MLRRDSRPGAVLCHHPLVVHGSGGNASATSTRIELSIRNLGDDVRRDPRPHTMTSKHDPRVAPGAFPADDVALPIVRTSDRGLVAAAA